MPDRKRSNWNRADTYGVIWLGMAVLFDFGGGPDPWAWSLAALAIAQVWFAASWLQGAHNAIAPTTRTGSHFDSQEGK